MSLSALLWIVETIFSLALCIFMGRSAQKLKCCLPVFVGLASLGIGILEAIRGSGRHFAALTYDSGAIVGATSMRAAVYTIRENVGWEMATVPIPHHSDFSVLLRVKAVTLNPSNFKHPMIPAAWPFIRHIRDWPIGYDVAGEVLSVGKSSFCADVRVGDKVWGMSLGVSSEYAVASCFLIAPIPGQLTFGEAAGLGVAGLTTAMAYERSSLHSGQSVLVIGASGGTGMFGVMMASALGANVTGICSQRNIDFVHSLKPGSPIAMVDYTSPEQMAQLASGGKQFDLIYDTVSSGAPDDPNYEPQLRPLLKPNGLYQAIGGPMPSLIDQARAMVDVATRPLGFSAQREGYDWFLLMPSKALMLRVNVLFDSGKLDRVPVDSTFDVLTTDTAIGEAMMRQKSRRAAGKIVLSFEGKPK